jgi:16S rRNA C967 or C1407 C5-methylase (RsmB/RsmF family)
LILTYLPAISQFLNISALSSPKAIRILPSKNMEGFFVSKFIKGE